MKNILGLVSLTSVASLTLLGAPAPAQACGGTFCDSGPQAMPVDQTGENILFVMGDSYVEAHIQIQYDPDSGASQFAWVVPVTVVPEFSVGSQALFDNMLNGSVPTYSVQQSFDDCSSGGDGTESGSGLPSTGGASTAGGTAGDSGDSGGPDVLLEDTVGAFDIAVLSGGTSAEVMMWLADNGYQQDPNAEPILDEYLQDQFLFAAFKLTNGADVAEIHPVALRFPDSDEACVPIRLTRIAAQEHMDIRTFFLADNRVVPRTYRHVLVNPLKIDWVTLAQNYKEVITLAVDAPSADGNAFVTEYAGVSTVVPQNGLYNGSWDAGPFPTIDPIDVVDTLTQQGLLECYGNEFCDFYHGLIQGLLMQFLPPPNGVTAEEFWSCLSCYEMLIDPMAWNGDEFATALQERIIDPGAHAVDLLETWPYLTRMYTTISPNEMMADPFFHQNPDLSDVQAFQQAQQRVLCNQDSVYTLPDGREVYLPAGSSWPAFQDEMPWVEDVEEIPVVGGAMNLVDNTEQIDELLAAYNSEHEWPPADGATSDTGGEGGSEGGSSSDGCSCRTVPTDFGAVLLGGVFALWIRRRSTS